MAKKVTDECVVCGACEPECPNEAISNTGSIYVIDSAKCSECVGAYDVPQCIESCPLEGCIVTDPDHQETREALLQKYAGLHP